MSFATGKYSESIFSKQPPNADALPPLLQKSTFQNVQNFITKRKTDPKKFSSSYGQKLHTLSMFKAGSSPGCKKMLQERVLRYSTRLEKQVKCGGCNTLYNRDGKFKLDESISCDIHNTHIHIYWWILDKCCAVTSCCKTQAIDVLEFGVLEL